MDDQPGRIVVGVDFGAPSVAAATWAVRYLAPGASVVLVHAAPPADAAAPAGGDDAATRLAALARSLGVAATTVVRDGDPAVCLAEVAAEEGAELVVVGAHRDHPTPWDGLGTTAERLVRRSPVPVVVAAGALDGAPRLLLVPVAADDISERAYAWTRRLEQRFDPKVAVVHVQDAPPGWPAAFGRDEAPPPESAAPSRWRRLLADRPPGRVFTDAVAGDATSGILAEADRFRSGLIVVDDRALAPARRPDADRLLRETARPLLVVPGRAGGTAADAPDPADAAG